MPTAVKVRSRGSAPTLPRAAVGGGDKQLVLPGQHEKLKAVENSSRFAIPVGTDWVERDVLFVSEEIARRWPNLIVVSCSCGRCMGAGHYPHMVMESCKDGSTKPVLGFVEFGRHLIEQLHAAHASQTGDLLDRVHAENQKVIQRAKSKNVDQREEAKEIVVSALRSNKLSWKGPGGLKTDAHTRRGRVV